MEGVRWDNTLSREEWQTLLECIEEVKYGTITLIIQDGKLLRIEKTQKIKLN